VQPQLPDYPGLQLKTRSGAGPRRPEAPSRESYLLEYSPHASSFRANTSWPSWCHEYGRFNSLLIPIPRTFEFAYREGRKKKYTVHFGADLVVDGPWVHVQLPENGDEPDRMGDRSGSRQWQQLIHEGEPGANSGRFQ